MIFSNYSEIKDTKFDLIIIGGGPAGITIALELEKKKMQSKMVLQIHDELIFEFPKSEESRLKKLVVDKMENVVELSVPLIVDYGIGKNWYEAH